MLSTWHFRYFYFWGLVALLPTSVGCGVQSRKYSSDASASMELREGNAELEKADFLANDAVPTGRLVQAGENPKPTSSRKLIYDANISLDTEDLDVFSKALIAEIERFDGFISDFSQRRYAGDRQTGEWTIRVRSENFSDVLDWLDSTYDVRSKKVTSQDVTEEYVDLQARLKNKRNTEDRLSNVLDERAGKLDEVLSVEKEIDRVREEIERIEGRLRFLTERTSLSTITLTVNTRTSYTPAKEQALGDRVASSWNSSLGELRRASENFIVGLVGIVLWIPIWIVGLFVGYKLVRFILKRLAKAIKFSPDLPASSQPTPPQVVSPTSEPNGSGPSND